MDLGAISNVTSNAVYNSKNTVSEKDKEESASKSGFTSEAAVYEKSEETTSATYNNKIDRTALVSQLKAEQEAQKARLFEMVQKTITGQGNTLATADDMWKFLASGDFTVDAETKAQAQADIAEDGYWGVEKTSDRIVDFAIALSGDDPSKAEELLNAFKKGFDEATKAWGKELPDISKKTYDKVLEKFDSWKNGTYNKTEA